MGVPQEVVGGLALDWQGLVEHYEQTGHTDIAEQIRETGRCMITELPGGDIVTGEQHVRLIEMPAYEKRFRGKIGNLGSGDLIIVEHDSNGTNEWSASSPQQRYMDMAQQYATEHKIKLHILDANIGDRYKVWEAAGIGDTVLQSDFYFLVGLNLALQNFSRQSITEMHQHLTQAFPDTSSIEYTHSLRGILAFAEALESDDTTARLAQIATATTQFLQLDARARGISYPRQVREIKKENPNSRLFVVVGNSHRLEIVEALDRPDAEVEFQDQDVQSLAESIKSIRETTTRTSD